MHYTLLEDFVKEIYMKIGIKNPEEINMNNIASFFGTRIIYTPFSSRAFTKPFVGINILDTLSCQEKWMDFSHELYHILMDVGVQFLMPKLLIELREYKANSFMYHFCIPTFMLEKLIYPAYNTALFIAEIFNVTLEFAEKRLNQYKRKLLCEG